MALILDSSLWIDFTRKKSPAELKAKIHPWIMDSRAAICEAVAFEVLRHATPLERGHIIAQFSSLPLLPTPPGLWKDATRLGQDCRDKGFNAGSMDLLIAATALHHRAELITFDGDYAVISKITGLRVTVLKRIGF